MIPTAYAMRCETFRFAWRNEGFVCPFFLVLPSGLQSYKVAQKRSQAPEIIGERNIVRGFEDLGGRVGLARQRNSAWSALRFGRSGARRRSR